jgi:ribosomal protein S18 acetylase RimI-like enzyme
MSISIKRLNVGDAAALDRIAPDVFDEPIDARRLDAYLRSPGHIMVLAFEDELVVGQCTGVVHRHPDKPTELYVDELGTASTHRRMGIGRRLLDALFAWGRELGCEEAWLGTELDNDAANALYRSVPPIEDEAMRYYLFRL